MKTEIIRVNPKELKLLEMNARYMRHEEYAKLVNNIKADGRLTSVPFCWKTPEGKWEVLSGNHRVSAAADAGLEEIDVMVTEEPLTEQQRIAIQLSHNSIAGQDDPAILKALYEKIDVLDLKIYSGLDDKTLELLADVKPFSLKEANLEFQSITVVFLPDELEKAKTVLDEVRKILPKTQEKWMARFSAYDKWLDSVETAGDSHGVKNTATAIDVILKVFNDHITDLSKVWEDEKSRKAFVPLSTIFGLNSIPPDAAKIVKKAIDKMMSRGVVRPRNLWQCLEYWAADYLAGA